MQFFFIEKGTWIGTGTQYEKGKNWHSHTNCARKVFDWYFLDWISEKHESCDMTWQSVEITVHYFWIRVCGACHPKWSEIENVIMADHDFMTFKKIVL